MAILPKTQPWSPEEDRRLRILWQAEWSTLAIAVTLGRSKNAVCARARRIDLPLRPSPIPVRICPEKVAAFRREIEAGKALAREEIERAA